MSTPRWVRYIRDITLTTPAVQDDWTNFVQEKTLLSLTRLPGAVEPGINTTVLENQTNIAEDLILSVKPELATVLYADASPALKYLVRGLALLLLAELQGNKPDIQKYMTDVVGPFVPVTSAGVVITGDALPKAGQATLVATTGYELEESTDEDEA